MGKDFADRRLERTIDRTATGTLVASASEALSKFGHVHFPFAAQAHAEPSIRQFAEKHRNLGVRRYVQLVLLGSIWLLSHPGLDRRRSFAAGETDVLVATTVVEVGVDVANATTMVMRWVG